MLGRRCGRDCLELVALRRREPEGEEQPVEVAVLAGKGEVAANDGLERGHEVAVVGGRGYERVPQARRAVVDERVEQAALAAEVVVHRRLGDPGRLHDLLHADGVVAALTPQLQGAAQDDLAVVHGPEYTERYRRPQEGLAAADVLAAVASGGPRFTRT